MPTQPIPIVIAADVLQERDLAAFLLDVIERKLSSRCLDDDDDSRVVAETLAAALVHRVSR